MFKDTVTGYDLISQLGQIEDPRIERKKLYPLEEILLVTLCALLSSFEGFRAFEIYGTQRLEWLKQFLPFEHGIPSHDTFGRIFTLLNPDIFAPIFEHWLESLKSLFLDDDAFISIDGKTHSGSRQAGDKYSALHTVSAFASDIRVVLGQAKSPYKGAGEVERFFKRLSTLDVTGTTLTLDAAHCHRKVANAILDKGANYIIFWL